jgi:hypothetical protein
LLCNRQAADEEVIDGGLLDLLLLLVESEGGIEHGGIARLLPFAEEGRSDRQAIVGGDLSG